MNKKALLAAVAAAVIGAGLLYLYLQRFEEETSGGAPVNVLVARQDIPLGTQLTKAMVIARPLPQTYVEERHIVASDVDRIVGVRVSTGLRANESILWSDLATTTEQRRDLSALVHQGMRAVTVRAGLSSSFGGLLRPGDRVDVLLTAERNGGVAGGGIQRVTIPLLQNLLVLAIGLDTGGVQQGGSGARASAGSSQNQVTLSATVAQAQVLTFAGSRGTLTLTLRNPDDIAVIEGLPETGSSDIFAQEARAPEAPREHAPEPQTPTRVGNNPR